MLSWADGLRQRYFPPERSWLKAHVTLFHAFAPSLREELQGVLARVAGEFAPPAARIDGLMDLGTGTALAIRSEGMHAIRGYIADHFHGALTAQDKHPPRLHITIQNKVERADAAALQKALMASLPTRDFAFTGLGLHLYIGPRWEESG